MSLDDRIAKSFHRPMLKMLVKERLKNALPNGQKTDALANLLEEVRLEQRNEAPTGLGNTSTLEMQLWFRASTLQPNEFYVVRNEYYLTEGVLVDWEVALDQLLQVNSDLLLQLAVTS